MENIINSNLFVYMFISPEELAKYVVIVFFTLINLFITYIILKKFLFKPTMKFLDKRKNQIVSEIDEAKKIKREADMKYMEASERLENSIHEATNIVNDAKTQAQAQSETIISSAKKEAGDIITRADSDIERMRKQMMEEIRDEVAELCVTIASKVIKQSIDKDRQKEIIDRFIGEEFYGKENQDATK